MTSSTVTLLVKSAIDVAKRESLPLIALTVVLIAGSNCAKRTHSMTCKVDEK